MQEDFLQYLWQYQHFNHSELKTDDGKELQIIKPGFLNQLAGPDFKEAHLIIDGIEWHGSVEIHVKASEWKRHGHQGDANYDNVILHVVHENDYRVKNPNNLPIPTLSLKGLVKPGVMSRYEQILKSRQAIPCSGLFPKAKTVTKLNMLEAALIERLQRKGELFQVILKRFKNDWEQATYIWLARGFGFKINAENMMELAEVVPLRYLRKSANLFEWEALLYGASGLLDFLDNNGYADELRREFVFLEQKFQLKTTLNKNQWHFKGTRPSNFPTVRIAQFAAFIYSNQNLFSLFTDFNGVKDLEATLKLKQSGYWQVHTNFGDIANKKTIGLSKTAVRGLMINTIAPLLVAYADYKEDQDIIDKALNVLMSIPPEDNHIIRKWKELGWNVNSSFDTQGLIEIYNQYCSSKKCMKCKIGAELVNPS